jgi:hypothetical protein
MASPRTPTSSSCSRPAAPTCSSPHSPQDQATEIPLPDADCRRRLLPLYGEGLDLRFEDPNAVVARTEGVSASFIKELLRRATLFAAEVGGDLVVTDRHANEALDELLVAGGTLTMRLLGGERPNTGPQLP